MRKPSQKKRHTHNIIEKTIGLPDGIISGSSHLEINGNREVIVEGCKAILQYDDNAVRINNGKMMTSFEGRGLEIKCLTQDSLIITGFITSIRFDM